MTPAQPAGASAPDLVQLCKFVVGGQEYAIDIMRVKEIINPLPITPVPGAPGFMEGVIELRGLILPVVDLRKRFGLEAGPPTRQNKYVLVALDGRIVALVVDAVREFLRKGKGDIAPTPTLMPGQQTRYFAGVCHHDGRIVMILDIDKVLTTQERISLDGVGAAGPGA
jgi:purine-binding chemotaxis protein CheW